MFIENFVQFELLNADFKIKEIFVNIKFNNLSG